MDIYAILLAIFGVYLFIYCNRVSTWWQMSVGLYKHRKETAEKDWQYTQQYKDNTKTQNTQIENKIQNKKKYKMNIKKNMSSN